MTPPIELLRRSVVVTGAAGFIGSTLCRRLVGAGHSVIGYDDLSRGRREYLPRAVELVEGDVRDGGRLDNLLSTTKPDCLIHLAALHFIPDCLASPQQTFDINVAGTRCVLASCRAGAVRHVIFASSAAVYAPSPRPCVEDETPLCPIEVYGESKLAAEQLIRSFHADTGVPSTILRLFNAIGRRETNPHVIPHIFESLLTSDTVPLGALAPRRDYIDSRDVADAILSVLEAPDGLRVLNVGTGRACSVSDILTSLTRILGRPIAAVEEGSRLRAVDRQLLVADIGRIRHATGWAPRIDLEETLRDLVSVYGLRAGPHAAE